MQQVKADVIQRAYSHLRISGLTVNPVPEELDLALFTLEDMMASFFERNICVNYAFEDDPDPNTFTNVPRSAWLMMSSNLAIRLVPDFNKAEHPRLTSIATGELSRVSGKSMLNKLQQVQYPRRQARGSGSSLRYNRWQRYYRDQPFAPTECRTNYVRGGEINDYVEHFDALLEQGETIATYRIFGDPDLTVLSDSFSGTDIFYRVKIADTPTSSTTGFQNLKFEVTSSTGRKVIRDVNFQLREGLSQDQSLKADGPNQDVFFDETYWASTGFTWTGTQWDAAAQTATLTPITTGPNAGWQSGYRPVSVDVTVNSGTYGVGSFTVLLQDALDNTIGQTAVTFATASQSITVNVPLTFGSDIAKLNGAFLNSGAGTWSITNVVFNA